jgi:phosphoglycolate phosphatase-like HAD superfamily hydrolase
MVTAPVVVLFDIDGTILLTDGAGREALRTALSVVYGTMGPLDSYDFHGKTDPQIVLELMGGAGLEVGLIRSRLPRVWPVYLDRLRSELEERRRAGRITLLPGVAELLESLGRRPGVLLGLLTGNIEEGARLKLRAAGISARFAIGAYGSDSEARPEVARIALERIGARVGGLAAGAVVVVGDTPEDIACARAVRARAVAVATGRHAVAELEAAGADAVFNDLSDTDRVLECILKLAAAGGTYTAAGSGEGR